MVKEGELEPEEGQLYEDIYFGYNIAAVPNEVQSRNVKDDLDAMFFNLFTTELIPEERGKPLKPKDLNKATKRTNLENVEKYRKSIVKARWQRHLTKSEFDNRMAEISLIRTYLIDEKVNSEAIQIYKRHKSVLQKAGKFVDQMVPRVKKAGEKITPKTFREASKDVLRERLKAGMVQEIFEEDGRTMKKDASEDMINEIWRRERDRAIREAYPELSTKKSLPNAIGDGTTETTVDLEKSDAEPTRLVSQKEIKKSNSATERMIRAVRRGGTASLEELRDPETRKAAEQRGVDITAVFQRFGQEP
jgi:hypothetical protein